jgi:hypothetical protein
MSRTTGRILVWSICLSLVATLASAQSDSAKVFHGTVYAESYNQVMVIAVDNNSDGLMDTAFVVATAEPFGVRVSYRWHNADIIFKPSGLMITSPSEREALIVTFRRDVPRATFAAPEAFHVTRVANAIGLAHHSALADVYPMDRMPSGNSGHVKSDAIVSTDDGWTRQPFQNDWGWAGSGGGSCTSGGSGATSCSIGGCINTSGKNDCSATCVSGYYACCNCGNCTCLRYDGRN